MSDHNDHDAPDRAHGDGSSRDGSTRDRSSSDPSPSDPSPQLSVHDDTARSSPTSRNPGPWVEKRTGALRDGHAFRAYAAGMLETGTVRTGRPLPMGVELRDGGANFAVFSRHATQVWLELYEKPGDGEPQEVVGLHPQANRTGDIWHVWVQGVKPGQLYGYRVDGPYEPENGHRFNPHKLLIDPYATAITHLETWDFSQARGYDSSAAEGSVGEREYAMSADDNAAVTPKCVITQTDFDWEGDTWPKRPWAETIIYEMHVRGYTRHASSGVDHPGTFRGVIEKIPYLKELGVTAVELMPVQEFNEFEVENRNPLTGERLRNFWGYNPTAFMAPNGLFAADGSRGQQVLEFKQMVKALHEAGIEVILDVVFNHTAEGNEQGPTFSWRGFDNAIYYVLGEDPSTYRDYTGTGNTIKADHPVVRDHILDALRYWVLEMHVDGFRFDLASVLGRDQDGTLLADPPLIERIAEDAILRDVKIIAEAWDAAGAYQVGSFHGGRWAEWNGRFRDDVRRFWHGAPGARRDLASRLAGSSDLYEASSRGPLSSVNYVTSHDGFTLNDLVSYNRKHNLANGEANRDGQNDNYSHNHGVEGETGDPDVSRLRERQIRNFLVTLFTARGVPMLLAGDEFRRTQGGNNNAYCQDNETSWVDWSKREMHAGLVRFVRELARFRRATPALHSSAYYRDADVTWLDERGETPDWHNDAAQCLAMLVPYSTAASPFDAPGEAPADPDRPVDVLLLFNADTHVHDFTLPDAPGGGAWMRKVDTHLASPHDVRAAGDEPRLDDPDVYALAPRTAAVLIAER